MLATIRSRTRAPQLLPACLARGKSTLPGRLGDPEMLLLNEPRMNKVALEHYKKDLVLGRWGIVGRPFPPPVDHTSPTKRVHQWNYIFEKYIIPKLFVEEKYPMPDCSGLEQRTEVIKGVDGNDITLYIDRPKGDAKVPGILHTHGGGMMVMSSGDLMYRGYCARLANRGFAVVSVDFRNSSGRLGNHPYPAGLTDCMSGLAWTHANREALGLSKLILHGESGGGNLALATALRAKREGRLNEFDGVYAMCPFIAGPELWGDRAFPSMKECDCYFLDVNQIMMCAKVYDPERKHVKDPCTWPSNAERDDLEGLPPHVISVTELDPLLDEGRDYHQKLQNAGVQARFRSTPGLPHGMDIQCSGVPGAEYIFEELLEDVYSFAESL